MSPFTLKPGTIDDAPTLAALHIAGWQGAYGGIVDDTTLNALNIDTRTADWHGWLRDDPTLQTLIGYDTTGHEAGFCAYGKLRTPPPGQSNIRPQYTAEIMALYLRPAYYRQGLGRVLIRQAAADLMAQRHQGLALWVLAQNTRACGFYTALGGQRIGSHDVPIGPKSYREVCYGWRDMRRHFT